MRRRDYSSSKRPPLKRAKFSNNNFLKGCIKVLSRTALETDSALFTTNREVNTKVIGTTTKWTGMEHFITLMEGLHIKVNGKTTHFTVKEFYIIKSQTRFMDITTLDRLISVKLNNRGFITMDGFRMIKNMVSGSCC